MLKMYPVKNAIRISSMQFLKEVMRLFQEKMANRHLTIISATPQARKHGVSPAITRKIINFQLSSIQHAELIARNAMLLIIYQPIRAISIPISKRFLIYIEVLYAYHVNPWGGRFPLQH